ncbi:MAG: orotidine 5'-phosphate decarboxylase [Candidatus Blackburnbacteria bacterium RIFCSPHIGHO2_01_FULL_43_15b]|uniref:Orotidine 5'-phosphate decarboxylase n=1 Tax=Candidatus Blackburnbacteria bacterium RIFCSPHIGHO2_01_FULL_43_15b TaxID=1797513 RepID=A0A1G1V300_9BACT|nr:MAG: orotidine 5'-phosphate decarboxylase [Candidatus Blackburnbacteria bacterium RIFCSPHIGHO2_01_FULL_43_15b]
MSGKKARIAVALDVNQLSQALRLVEALHKEVDYFKVGLELLHAEGTPRVLAALQSAGAMLFVDWKLHDIPETVKKAVQAIAPFEVPYFNLHASTGRTSIHAAVEAAGKSRVLGVTVLTSLDDAECTEIFGAAADIKVPQFARTFVSLGGHAIICSAKEAQLLRNMPELDSAELWTPGIRPLWAAARDQKRVLSPADAVRAGADVLIIGRPITQPPGEIGSPVEAAKRIRAEIEEALAA